MGDIIHALPAVARLKQNSPAARLTWVVEPKWAPLLEGNPYVDRVLLLRRRNLLQSWRDLRAESYDVAIDFQGLMKSALVVAASGAQTAVGFDRCRERPAALFYTRRIVTASAHVVDRNLELALVTAEPNRAAAAGSVHPRPLFPLPPGAPEATLPPAPFVLASPLAGWRSKQWPLEYFASLAAQLRALGVPLVLDVPPASDLPIENAIVHRSGLPGLIYATRQAAAVVGVDSGPMHLAAALGKPGVAIFGPTDPARNGPCGVSLRVLRSPSAATTYQRRNAIDDSMRQVSPGEVFELLRGILGETS